VCGVVEEIEIKRKEERNRRKINEVRKAIEVRKINKVSKINKMRKINEVRKTDLKPPLPSNSDFKEYRIKKEAKSEINTNSTLGTSPKVGKIPLRKLGDSTNQQSSTSKAPLRGRCIKKNEIKKKAGVKAMITERDIAILQEVNRHGFMGVAEISRTFKMPERVAYTRLQKMTEAGLLKHERILYAYPGVYWLTFVGRGVCKSSLSTLNRPSIGTFEHDMKLLRLCLALKEKYAEKLTAWMTPRELRANKFNLHTTSSNGFKAAKSHTPDALLGIDTGSGITKIALELELSVKSTPRLKNIIEKYTVALHQGQVARVMYYCGSETIKRRVMEVMKMSEMANLFQITVIQGDTDGRRQ
jgi:DNA-binding Lrp family transcriptional regulator